MSLLTNIAFLISLFLLVVGQLQDLVNVTVPHTDSRLKYLGTWDFSPGEKCAWRNTRTSGSSALLNFRGTSIKILGDTQLSLSSTVFLDGKQFGVVDGQGCDAVIFEGPGLDDEEHTIELVSANSPLGTLHLSGFVYTERGASAKQVRLPDHPLSTGAIAGIVVAVGGFIGLVGSIFLCWDYIIYFRLVSLLLGWLGWSVETKRRIFFKALKSLGTTEISLFLTTKEELEDFKEGDRERPLVWQVLHIGNTKREFNVDVPWDNGNIQLGFATIHKRNNIVECQDMEKAPARLLDRGQWPQWKYEGGDERERKANRSHKTPPKPFARNMSEFPASVALGTYDSKRRIMKPVLVVESILHGAVYKTQQEFYLHAFRTEGYKAGQYGESIVQSVVEGRLTPTEGINLSTLPPLSGCYLGDGMVQLEIGPMKRKDVVLAALTFLKDTMLPVFLFLKRIMPPFLVYVKERVLLAFATFNTRRLIFKTDENLPLTQISLFLTTRKTLTDFNEGDQEVPIVWQVFNIGGAQRHFQVDIPWGRSTGSVYFGFSTVEDSGFVVRSLTAAKAPASLLGDGMWDDYEEKEGGDKGHEGRPNLLAKNASDHSATIALGIHNERQGLVQPAILIRNLLNGAVYETEDSFFLHAFRTNGYRTGQYGTTLVANIAGDRLTPVEGIMISNLRPLTCWKIGDTGNGMLQLGMEHPTYPDLKAYRHEEKISKHAISKV